MVEVPSRCGGKGPGLSGTGLYVFGVTGTCIDSAYEKAEAHVSPLNVRSVAALYRFFWDATRTP